MNVESDVTKLSGAQQRALRKLGGYWQSAYELGESLGTLNALVGKGLVERTDELGSLFFPRTSIKFRVAP